MKKGASQIQSHSGNPTNQPVRPQPLRRGFPEVPSSNSNGLPTAPASRRYASILFLCHSFPCLFNLVSPANSDPFQPIPTLKKDFFCSDVAPSAPSRFFFKRLSALRVPCSAFNTKLPNEPIFKNSQLILYHSLAKKSTFRHSKNEPIFPSNVRRRGILSAKCQPNPILPTGDTTRLPSPAWTPTCLAKHLRRRKLGSEGGRRIAPDHGARVHDRGLWHVCPRIGVIPPRFCALASLALGHR
jgi:hypothetical protein